MAQIIVRNIEDDVKVGLKAPVSQHGWSMEEEVRQILRATVNTPELARIKRAWAHDHFEHQRVVGAHASQS